MLQHGLSSENVFASTRKAVVVMARVVVGSPMGPTLVITPSIMFVHHQGNMLLGPLTCRV